MERDSRVHLPFSGYTGECDGKTFTGARATPDLFLHTPQAGVRIATTEFWQNFPKSLGTESSSRLLCLGLLPRDYDFGHELQGGERTTHAFSLAFGPESRREDLFSIMDARSWCASPQWFPTVEALPHFVPRDGADSDYCALVDDALDPDKGLAAKREIIDEYGWRNFGELYADHEAKYHESDEIFVSHYNNQYDPILGFGVNFLRTGEAAWFQLFDELARRVLDIDLYHTKQDRSAFNQGMFWHTGHYHTAQRCTHRTFPSEQGPGGGSRRNTSTLPACCCTIG